MMTERAHMRPLPCIEKKTRLNMKCFSLLFSGVRSCACLQTRWQRSCLGGFVVVQKTRFPTAYSFQIHTFAAVRFLVIFRISKKQMKLTVDISICTSTWKMRLSDAVWSRNPVRMFNSISILYIEQLYIHLLVGLEYHFFFTRWK